VTRLLLLLLAPFRLALSAFLVGGVRFYQLCLRPLLPAVCRFQPSCSEYFIAAVRKYGPVCGACKGVWRICRCNPFSAGGFDPP
jgi:putative membrane protein insertion efficiency factor